MYAFNNLGFIVVCVLKMIYTVQCNCLQSTVSFQFFLWRGITIYLHIKVMCLIFLIKFESVLTENSLKTH